MSDNKHQDLLAELESVQSLLDKLEKKRIPVLSPDMSLNTPPPHDTGEAADNDYQEEQIPLLDPDSPPTPAQPALPPNAVVPSSNAAATSRPNPFLPQSALDTLQARQQHAPEAQAQPPKATLPTTLAQRAALSDQEIQHIVDDVLAQWLPKIEQTLRDTLTHTIRKKYPS